MKVKPHSDSCPLGVSQGDVHLSIAFGDGQTGTSLVLRGDTTVAAGGDLENVLVGTVDLLKGKSIVVRSLVSQTNSAADRFSVTHEISASETHQEFSVTDTFADGESSVSVRETISFPS